MKLIKDVTYFNRKDLILILAPERCGTHALLTLLAGYNRLILHNNAFDFKPGPGYRINQHEEKFDAFSSATDQKVQLAIVIVRDPIGRIVSDVFHKLERNELPAMGDTSPAEYILMMGCHEDAAYHMEYEVNPILSLRIVNQSFRPPLTMYAGGEVTLVITRLEDFDVLPAKLQDMGLDVADKIERIGATRTYPKEKIKFPSLYVNRILSMDYTKAFYSEDEIEKMRQKWTEE